MTEFNRMHEALGHAFAHRRDKKSLRVVARKIGIPLATLSRALREPVDSKLSTMTKLWQAAGFKVTIWCQGPGREAYIFEEETTDE